MVAGPRVRRRPSSISSSGRFITSDKKYIRWHCYSLNSIGHNASLTYPCISGCDKDIHSEVSDCPAVLHVDFSMGRIMKPRGTKNPHLAACAWLRFHYLVLTYRALCYQSIISNNPCFIHESLSELRYILGETFELLFQIQNCNRTYARVLLRYELRLNLICAWWGLSIFGRNSIC